MSSHTWICRPLPNGGKPLSLTEPWCYPCSRRDKRRGVSALPTPAPKQGQRPTAEEELGTGQAWGHGWERGQQRAPAGVRGRPTLGAGRGLRIPMELAKPRLGHSPRCLTLHGSLTLPGFIS